MFKQQNTRGNVARAVLAVAAISALAFTTACSSNGGGESSADELVIGMALSQSGNMAGYDSEPGEAALLAVDEINASGGVNGRQIRTIQKDVASDPETVGVVAQELIDQGIDLLITPCDFDLSAPGMTVAQADGVPAISICASDPKAGDATTVGDYIFTAADGSDAEGSTGATFAFSQGLKNAYLLQDESIEYTKSAGRYFAAAFENLGGSIVGQDSFPGGDNVDVSAQIANIKSLSTQPDVIYVASWNPGGATAIKQIREAGIETPIVGPQAIDGQSLLDIVGDAKDIYLSASACYVYCSGADSQEELDAFVADFKARTGGEPSSSYTILGYNMMLGIANALQNSEMTDGAVIRDALQSAGPTETPIGQVQYFSATCHKIIDPSMTIIKASEGKMTFVEQVTGLKIPKIGDGNTCAS